MGRHVLNPRQRPGHVSSLGFGFFFLKEETRFEQTEI